MPRFDVSLWKSIHPASTEGSGIVAAIKEWQAHCPDHYDAPNADPKRLAGAVAPVVKKFLAAIHDAENKLGRDKSPDAETKAKIAKTKTLLAKWETEVTNYQKGVMKWWQESIKEEGEEKRSLARAQLEFTTVLVDELQVMLGKMPALSKQFDLLLKARRLDDAGPVLRDHRHLLMQARYLVKPVAIVSARNQVAHKYKVEPTELKVPPKFNDLAKKLGEMNTRDDDMQHLLERALEGEVDDDADPGAALGPEYRKAVRELANACQSNAAKIKAIVSVAAQLVRSVKQIQAIPPGDAAYPKGVAGFRAINQKMLATNKEMRALRDQGYGKTGPLRDAAKAVDITPADEGKFLLPHVRLAVTYTKRFVTTCEEVSTLMEDWLEEAVAAHPAAADAKGELASVKARKYTVQLL